MAHDTNSNIYNKFSVLDALAAPMPVDHRCASLLPFAEPERGAVLREQERARVRLARADVGALW